MQLRCRNTSDGTGNGASVEIGNDTDDNLGRFRVQASGYTTSNHLIADGVCVEAIGSGGLTLAANHGSGVIKMFTGGTTRRAELSTAGLLSLVHLSGTYGVPGIPLSNVTTVGTDANTSEKDLHSHTLPASSLASNGARVKFCVAGSFGANANSKTVRLYFGSTVLVAETTSINAGHFSASAVITRTGAATQTATAQILIDEGGSAGVEVTTTAPTETLSGSVTIKVTGQNGTASANDIQVTQSWVEMWPVGA